MLYAFKSWPLKRMDLAWLQRNERAIRCWMCTIKPTGDISTQDIRLRLCIEDLDVALRQKHLRWFSHVQRSESWISRVCSLHVKGFRTQGRPRKSWWEVLLERGPQTIWTRNRGCI